MGVVVVSVPCSSVGSNPITAAFSVLGSAVQGKVKVCQGI